MKNKKQAFVTFRCSEETKILLEQISTKKEWSLSHTVEKIIREYFNKGVAGKTINLAKYIFLLSQRAHSDLRTMCVDLMRPLSLQTTFDGGLPKIVIETR